MRHARGQQRQVLKSPAIQRQPFDRLLWNRAGDGAGLRLHQRRLAAHGNHIVAAEDQLELHHCHLAGFDLCGGERLQLESTRIGAELIRTRRQKIQQIIALAVADRHAQLIGRYIARADAYSSRQGMAGITNNATNGASGTILRHHGAACTQNRCQN